MVTFFRCAERCRDENAVNIHETIVNELQAKLGSRHCSCHPDYEWKIDVDILEDCKSYHLHEHLKDNNRPSCGFQYKIMYEARSLLGQK